MNVDAGGGQTSTPELPNMPSAPTENLAAVAQNVQPDQTNMMAMFRTLMREELAPMKVELSQLAPLTQQLDRVISKTEHLESIVLQDAGDDQMSANQEGLDDGNESASEVQAEKVKGKGKPPTNGYTPYCG